MGVYVEDHRHKGAFMRIICLAALVTVVAGATSACRASDAAQRRDIHQDVMVSRDARGIKVGREGTDVVFTVSEPYPADEIFADLRIAYHPPEWSQVDELVLFPGQRTSETPGGWTEHDEKNEVVRRWMGNWRKIDGTVVTYVITYRWPPNRRLDADAPAEVHAILTRPR
jgi:hypothetical protein